jgi:RNA polymerase sigma-70 factor (ECF subfamily)
MPETTADSVLVERCREGDQAAFDVLVLRHRERAMAAARALVPDWESAEDLVQEAFLLAVRGLPGLREGAKFGAWLHTILTRLAVRYRPASGNGRPRLLSLSDSTLFINLAAPQEDDTTGELRLRVRAALSELTRQSREVLELFYLEGLTHAEIAHRLQLPVGTVKRRVHDSKARFRKEWAKMARETSRTEPGRRMSIWTNGDGPGEGGQLMHGLLAQSIALAVSKRARTTTRIVEQVEAHAAYVQPILDSMVRLELAVQQGTRYLLNFPALERDDYEQVQLQVKALGREVAEAVAPLLSDVRAAYERTSLPRRGWGWERRQWVMTAVPVLTAAPKFMGKEVSGDDLLADRPLQPDGKRYWIDGIERTEGKAAAWPSAKLRTVGPFDWQSSNGMGWLNWPGHEWRAQEQFGETPFAVVRVLADGPHSLNEITAGAGLPEKDLREAVTGLVEQGLVSRKGRRFALTFPVFTGDDTETLKPVLREAVAPAMERVLRPGNARLESLLADLGYGRFDRPLKNLRFTLTHTDVRGWALLHLLDTGALAQPPADDSPDWNTFGWVGDSGTPIFWMCG